MPEDNMISEGMFDQLRKQAMYKHTWNNLIMGKKEH